MPADFQVAKLYFIIRTCTIECAARNGNRRQDKPVLVRRRRLAGTTVFLRLVAMLVGAAAGA